MRSQSESAFQRLRPVSDNLNAMYEGAIDPDSESLHQAQAAARNLRTTLEELGIPVSERLEQFPEQLHNLYFAPDQAQNFQENAANLEEMADRIEQTATAIARSLRAMAQKQREHANQSEKGSNSVQT